MKAMRTAIDKIKSKIKELKRLYKETEELGKNLHCDDFEDDDAYESYQAAQSVELADIKGTIDGLETALEILKEETK